ncbi:MAG: DUF996 domain-containing protein [Thermoproteus sp. AZ2]|jgi:uncharacterized membrane protein|uniref:DUF996 domain-containing protein n=1 Tax=Thermoproteus sp. AZ2 TaxID=1609232 RepID=A0ACC6V368_9CREN
MDKQISGILAGVGAILAAIGPFGHGVAGAVGTVLLFVGLALLADFYGDRAMREDATMWFILAFIATVVLAFAFGAAISSFIAELLSGRLLFSAVSLAVGLAGLIASWLLYIYSGRKFKNIMDSLAAKTGEGLYRTAGDLYRWGAVLVIVVVGVLLLAVAYIIAGVALLITALK